MITLWQGIWDIPDHLVPKCPPFHAGRYVERDWIKFLLAATRVDVDDHDRTLLSNPVTFSPHRVETSKIFVVARNSNLLRISIIFEVPIRGTGYKKVHGALGQRHMFGALKINCLVAYG